MSDAPRTPAKSFPVFVGWDPAEDLAWQVCRHSILRHSSIGLSVTPLIQHELRDQGLYRRPLDPLASTEFTYTRFLVPHLAGYEGWALFCDCDFLWTDDIANLVALADDRFAVMCVHHDHRPSERWKMNHQAQSLYPRKNWSSMVLYNCGHPANQALDTTMANMQPGSFLHRFAWLDDALIGEVPVSWNWLEGWCDKPSGPPPAAIHYTRGGPWFDNWQDVDYADLWIDESRRLNVAAAE